MTANMMLVKLRHSFQIYDLGVWILNAHVLCVLDIFQWETDRIGGIMRKFKPTVFGDE